MDSSIYDAMVRLGQPWKNRYPLVEFQGNNGSVNGDPQAAMRYTECKLSKVGEWMLQNLDSDVVPFSATYNEEGVEPVLLPSIFPNILCNGNDGIAVGMSSGILPHNLTEAVELLKAIIINPYIAVDEMLSIMPGPDFPLGGRIIDGYKIKGIYASGQGTVTLQSKYEIDTKKNIIKFYETPYLVDIDTRIVATIKKLVIEEDTFDIVDVENHVGKGECHINVILSKKANPQKVLKYLFEKTPLQKSVSVNQTIINSEGVPMQLSLLGLCKNYLNHQHNCIINIAKKEKIKQEKIAHINRGLELAIRSIDEAIKIIRNSDSKDIARKGLITLLGVDVEQADAILALQLGRLTRLDINDILVKIKDAEEAIKYQITVIENKDVRNGIIVENLDNMKSLFGDSRRTEVGGIEGPAVAVEVGESRRLIVVENDCSISELDVEINADDFKKGGKYAKLNPKFMLETDKEAVCVNSDGTTSHSPTPETVGLLEVDKTKQFLVTISKNGIIKRSATSEYKSVTKLCKLKKDDTLIGAVFCNENDKIICLLENGKATTILVSEIKLSGKLTIGNKGTDKSIVSWCCGNDAQCFYTLNGSNQIKRTSIKEMSGTLVLNDGVICIGTCANNWYFNGKIEKVNWGEFPIKGRTAAGSKLATKTVSILA